jgi:spermidine synthase
MVCVLLLLPPAVLMGATLPAISRYVQATPRDVSWLGFFYRQHRRRGGAA